MHTEIIHPTQGMSFRPANGPTRLDVGSPDEKWECRGCGRFHDHRRPDCEHFSENFIEVAA